MEFTVVIRVINPSRFSINGITHYEKNSLIGEKRTGFREHQP